MIVTIDHPTHVVMEQNFINILSSCTLHLQLNKYVCHYISFVTKCVCVSCCDTTYYTLNSATY